MRTLGRLAAGTALGFAISFLHYLIEQMSDNQLQIVVFSVVVTALVVGFVAGSAAVAALATVLGGFTSFVIVYFLGFNLWTPSPIASDLPIVRSLVLGATALFASGAGYLSASLFPAKQLPKVEKQPVSEVKEELRKEVAPQQEQKYPLVQPAEQAMKICKFCTSVIPVESVFCPMCGAKLVEEDG